MKPTLFILAAGMGSRLEAYAYYKMAVGCGIEMTDCRLMEENGRAHFMTKRFDRIGGKEKLHMQTLCGLTHFNYLFFSSQIIIFP